MKQEWIFENGIKVQEMAFDADLSCLKVFRGDNYLGTIYPQNKDDMEHCMNDLDNGSNPVTDKWEDGRGNTCSLFGWGDGKIPEEIYVVKAWSGEIKARDKDDIKPFCVANGDHDQDPVEIGRFNNRDDALRKAAEYPVSVQYMSVAVPYYLVEETTIDHYVDYDPDMGDYRGQDSFAPVDYFYAYDGAEEKEHLILFAPDIESVIACHYAAEGLKENQTLAYAYDPANNKMSYKVFEQTDPRMDVRIPGTIDMGLCGGNGNQTLPIIGVGDNMELKEYLTHHLSEKTLEAIKDWQDGLTDVNPVIFSYRNMNQYDFSGTDLSCINFIEAQLKDANFNEAILMDSTFVRADLQGASFKDADLARANFTNADMRRCHLEGADLSGAILTNARLEGAFLEGAILDGAEVQQTILALQTTLKTIQKDKTEKENRETVVPQQEQQKKRDKER